MHKTFVTAALILLSLSACGSAHIVRKDATGGHVALQGQYMLARGEARGLMAEHCHGRFEAIEHEDSVDYRCIKAKPATASLQIAEAGTPPNGIAAPNGM